MILGSFVGRRVDGRSRGPGGRTVEPASVSCPTENALGVRASALERCASLALMRWLSRAIATAALLLFAVACSSSDATAPPFVEVPAFSAPQKPRQSPPEHAVGGFSIKLPQMTLAPGDEQSPCFLFPLEVTGDSRLVGGGKITVGAGMHHGNITTRPKTGDGIRPCAKDDTGLAGEAIDVTNGGAVLFGSSTQIVGTEWQSFPEGMAYRVRDGFEIVARMHYLNVTDQPLVIEPEYVWFTIDPASLTHELGPFAWTNDDIHIPPKSASRITASCAFPKPMHIVNAMPHMHKLGTRFEVAFYGGALDGERFLDSPGYDPERGVIEQFGPAIDLSQGKGASFSCSWNNTLDKEIVEGIGDNEMCILFGYAYPPENAFSALGGGSSCVYVAPPAP